jgi:hypothetical protein
VLFQIHLELLLVQHHMVCSNIIMSMYTTTSDGLHVYVCNACFKIYEQPKHTKYVVFQSMDYMKQILVNNPLDLQLFSLINISIECFFVSFVDIFVKVVKMYAARECDCDVE